jgi:hypothetical protein
VLTLASEGGLSVTDVAESQYYITPPTDREVERISIEFLQSGGGFLSPGRGSESDIGGRLASSRAVVQTGTVDQQASPAEAEPVDVADTEVLSEVSAAVPPVASSVGDPATHDRRPAKSAGSIRRLISRLGHGRESRVPNGRQS